MNLSKIDERLLSYSGATKAFHEKWGWMVYWVGGKQFACEFQAKTTAKLPYAGKHLLSLKCDPERIIELRSEYPESIFPGYYSDGRTWISIDLDTDLPEDIVFDLCKRGYELVFATLPKKVQKELMSI
jgi:predicted DNA-binding protein (MmcQ/YjbR family)